MAEKLGEAVLELRTDSSKLDKGIDQAKGKTLGLESAFKAIGVAAAAGAAAAGAAMLALGNSALKATIEIEKIGNALSATFGSAGAAEEFAFLREEADRLGLRFQSLAGDYAQLAAAANGTALAGEKTRDIFRGISEASVALGLSAEQTSGAFRAVQQMISKGRVSAEELRQQLGERLPGAFQITARAIGVTTTELDKMLVKGELTADELLPALAEELRNTFGPQVQAAAESTQRQFDRLHNAIFDLKVVAGEQFAPALAQVVELLSQIARSDAAVKVFELLGKAIQFVITLLDDLIRVFGYATIGVGTFAQGVAEAADKLSFLPGVTKESAEQWRAFGQGAADAGVKMVLLANELEKTNKSLTLTTSTSSAAAVGITAVGKSAEEAAKKLVKIPETLERIETDVLDRIRAGFDKLQEEVQATSEELGVAEAEVREIESSMVGVVTATGNWLDELFAARGAVSELTNLIADNLYAAIRGVMEGDDLKDVFGRAGESLGSFFGEKYGSILGGILGGAKGTVLGSAIGAALGTGIGQKLAETVGGALDKLFGGGSDLKEKIAKFFKHFDAGTASIQQTEKAINLLDRAVRKLSPSKALSILEQQFDGVVDAAIRLGGTAVDALKKLADEMRRTGTGADLLQQKLRELGDEAKKLFEERAAFITGEVDKMLKGIEDLALTSAGSVNFAATTLTQAFNAMVSAGVPLFEIADKLGEHFDRVGEAGKRLGANLPPEFERLGKMMDLLADEGLRKVVEGLDGVAAAAQAAGNLGLLTAEQFTFFAARVRGAFDKLVEGGLDGKEAIAALAPQLQLLNDLAEQYGIEVGEGTRALLDQAKEMGVVTDKGLTMEDILIKGFDRMLEALNRVIVALGGIPVQFESIAGAAGEAANAVNHLGEEIGNLPNLPGIGGGRTGKPRLPNFNMGSGGFQDFGSGTPAILHGTEQVITASEGTGIARMVQAAIRNGTAGGDLPPRLLEDQTEWLRRAHQQRDRQMGLLDDMRSELARRNQQPFIQGGKP